MASAAGTCGCGSSHDVSNNDTPKRPAASSDLVQGQQRRGVKGDCEICSIICGQLMGTCEFGQLVESELRLRIDDLHTDGLKCREKAIPLVRRDQALTLVPQDDVDNFKAPNGRSEKTF